MTSRQKKKPRRKQKNRPRPPHAPHHGLPGLVPLADLPAGAEKMSEVILDFVAPYWDLDKEGEQLNELLSLATVAWNAALVPRAERDAFIRPCLEAVPPEVRPDVQAFLEEMIRRK